MTELAFDYSKRDPEYILDHLKQRAAELSDYRWTAFLDTDVGYATVKSVVHINNFDQFFCDQSVSECFLSTCLTREAAVRKAKELGYIPDLAIPAQCQIKVTCPAFGELITIPAGTAWLVGDKSFTSIEAIEVPSGQTDFEVTLVQGSAYQPTPTIATGQKFFKLALPRNLANIKVEVDNEEWEMIDTFIRPRSKKAFKRYEDVLGQTLCFGADFGTYAPQNGQSIAVSGILTSGKNGNTDTRDEVVKLVSIIRDSNNSDITNAFTPTMLTAAVGGTDIESIESIKENAPKYYSAQYRAVHEADYEAIVNKIPGIESVKAIGGEKLNRYGEVHLVITGSNPYSVSEDLRNLVIETLSRMDVVTITPIIKSPTVIEVMLAAIAEIDKSTDLTEASARTAITSKTTAYINGKPEEQVKGLGLAKDLHLTNSSAANKMNGLSYIDFSMKVSSFANSIAEKVVIPICENADLSNAELRKHSDGALLWSGNGESKIVNGYFSHVVSGLSNQRVDLIYKPSDPNNLLAKPDQIVWLTSLAIDVRFIN